MVVNACVACKKTITRTKKAVTCCVCSKLTHAECGQIDETIISAIIKGSIEWKCPDCRRKSTRRSIVNIGNDADAVKINNSKADRNTKADSNSKAVRNSKADRNPQSSKEPDSIANTRVNDIIPNSAMTELNDKITALHQGFTVASNAIEEMGAQMSTLQSISSKLVEHSSRITHNEDKIRILKREMKNLTRRMDELEYSSATPLLQINGIPFDSNENLPEIVVNIGKFIGVAIKAGILKTSRRLHIRKNKLVTDTNIQQSNSMGESPSVTSINKVGLGMQPIVIGFNNDTLQRNFISAFRRKGEVFTNDIGLTGEGGDQVKCRVFIFEHLTNSLRKTYVNAKNFQKSNNYKYLWTRDGKIFLRRSDNSKIIRVMPHTDLTKIEDAGNEIKGVKSSKDRRGGRDGVSTS